MDTCKILRDVPQATRADQVCCPIYFCTMLERKAERFTESLLAHAKHHSAHAYPTAHELVDLADGTLPYCYLFRSYHFARLRLGRGAV